MKLKLLFTSAFSLLGGSLFANPFVTTKPQDFPGSQGSGLGITFDPLAGLMSWMGPIQRDLQSGLSSFMVQAQSNPFSVAFLLLMAISLGYGIFHALLPGHQKMVVTSFFLTQKAKMSQALVGALVFGLAHTVFTLGLLVFFKFILQFTAGESLTMGPYYGQVVGILGVLVLGVILLVLKVLSWKKMRQEAHLGRVRQLMGFTYEKTIADSYQTLTWGRFLGVMVMTALVPCPGALLILFGALGMGSLWLGIWALVGVSIGMSLVLFVLGAGVLVLKNRGTSLLRTSARPLVIWSLEILGFVFMILFALALFPAFPG